MKQSKQAFPAYPSSPSSTKTCSLCRWPGCRSFCVTVVMSRNVGGEQVNLCSHHRRAWDSLSLTDVQRMPWEKQRRRHP
jgi:hypothetical protein